MRPDGRPKDHRNSRMLFRDRLSGELRPGQFRTSPRSWDNRTAQVGALKLFAPQYECWRALQSRTTRSLRSLARFHSRKDAGVELALPCSSAAKRLVHDLIGPRRIDVAAEGRLILVRHGERCQQTLEGHEILIVYGCGDRLLHQM